MVGAGHELHLIKGYLWQFLKVSSPIVMFSSSMSGDGECLRSCIGWMLKVVNTWGKKPGGRVRFHVIEPWKDAKRFAVVHIVVIFVSRCNILLRFLGCRLLSFHASIPALKIICQLPRRTFSRWNCSCLRSCSQCWHQVCHKIPARSNSQGVSKLRRD
jgi:hypothetical protein